MRQWCWRPACTLHGRQCSRDGRTTIRRAVSMAPLPVHSVPLDSYVTEFPNDPEVDMPPPHT
jgi:hypothetical protein